MQLQIYSIWTVFIGQKSAQAIVAGFSEDYKYNYDKVSEKH